jgi:hypothetical protein
LNFNKRSKKLIAMKILAYILLFFISCSCHSKNSEEDIAARRDSIINLAKQGNINAQFSLGRYYNSGYGYYGIEEDKTKSQYWLSKAGEQGSPKDQFDVGIVFYSNKEYDTAAYWFEKSAKKGDDNAQYWLGLCYFLGNGVIIDQQKGIYWFQKAAKHGNRDAQKQLKGWGKKW